MIIISDLSLWYKIYGKTVAFMKFKQSTNDLIIAEYRIKKPSCALGRLKMIF